jgi:predicted RNA binding protein YcfA (HicA-like mRNA interferase family)
VDPTPELMKGLNRAVRPRYNLARSGSVAVKVREIIQHLEADGRVHVRTKGSHRQYKHPKKPGTVTVAGKPGLEIPKGTLSSILKQAGLT